ncbi:MAG: TonB-dependent receptor, partial [Deferribacterales bacterium]
MLIKHYITILTILFTNIYINAQYLYKGIVKDKKSGEVLIGATIIANDNQVAISNNYGYFALKHTFPQLKATIQYVGYKSKTADLYPSSDLQIIEMEPDTILIKEVTVSSSYNLKTSGITQLTSRHFNSLPVLLGEKDLLKSMHVLSGVIQNAEGTTNFSFRGSNSGENLFLIDGIPVYNINHLYGFASIFNTDAINVANFYKNGIPSRYGGRNSSVTDVIIKEGNQKKYTGNFSLGLLSSRVLFEGPIKKDTASFFVAARRSFYDLFIAPIT